MGIIPKNKLPGRSQPMKPIQVRIPTHLREKAKLMAEQASKDGENITETDIYRSAIVVFLSKKSTDSRVND